MRKELVVISVVSFVCNGIISATFYEEISSLATIGNDSEAAKWTIHKYHHQCSIREACYFVVKDVRSQSYMTYSDENELPLDRAWHRIWRKIAGATNQGDAIELDYTTSSCKPGSTPKITFVSCQDAYSKGYRNTGVYPVTLPSIGVVNVRCDMTTDGGGWMVFQRRIDGTVDFYLTMSEYKNCFGDLNGNFWLGLDTLHQLAAPSKNAILRVDLRHMDVGERYAQYTEFSILNGTGGYKLKVSGYSGTAPDSLLYNNGYQFSAKDTSNCGVQRKGAWWYYACTWANLNGLYPSAGESTADRMSWYYFTRNWGRVTFSEMKIRYN